MTGDRSAGRSREGDLGRELRIVKIVLNYCDYSEIYLNLTVVTEPSNCVKTKISKTSKYSRVNVVRL